MTKQEYNKQTVKRCRTEWFKDHIKVPTADPDVILWRKPDSTLYLTLYLTRYQITGSYLIVTGDIGDAIYEWNQTISWEWLAGLDLEYFVSKCVASEVGRPYRSWSHRVATAWLDNWKKENPKLANALDETYSLGNPDDFREFLRANQKLFDFEDADVGEVLNHRAIGHWTGIQMMFGGKQLEYYA